MELPLHPLLVHLPIALAVLMPLLAGGLWFALRRRWLPLRTWLIVCVAQTLLLGSAILAMRSGEGDAERVERVERVVPETAIEHHEEAAELFTWTAGGVLLLSLLPLLLRRRPDAAVWGALATTFGAGVVLWLGYQVGHAGGELVYKHGAAAAFVGAASPVSTLPNARAGDEDDR